MEAELAAGLSPLTTEPGPLLGRHWVTQGLGCVCSVYGCKNTDLFTCCAGGFIALWCLLTPSAGAVGQRVCPVPHPSSILRLWDEMRGTPSPSQSHSYALEGQRMSIIPILTFPSCLMLPQGLDPWGVISLSIMSQRMSNATTEGTWSHLCPWEVPAWWSQSHQLSCGVVVSKCYNRKNSGLMTVSAFMEYKS